MYLLGGPTYKNQSHTKDQRHIDSERLLVLFILSRLFFTIFTHKVSFTQDNKLDTLLPS